MARSRYTVVTLCVLAAIVLSFVSFHIGRRTGWMEGNGGLASTQAMLAFGHYKTYEQIERYLERKCYEAALTEVREMKGLELKLAADNLRRSENDPVLVEYVRIRDSKFLEVVLTKSVPEPKPYTITCP